MTIILIVFLITAINSILLYLIINKYFYYSRVINRLYKGKKSIPIDINLEAKKLIKTKPKLSKGIYSKIRDYLDSTSLNINEKKFLLYTTIVCLLAFLFMFLITNSLILSISGLIFVPVIIIFILKILKKNRIKTISSQLNETIDFLSSSLKSGYGLMQGIDMIAKNGAKPISEEFERLLQDINLGKSYEEAFDKLVERNPLEEIEILAVAIQISRETGGNLSNILDTVSETMREREKLNGQIKSLTAQGRLSGIILIMLPIVLVGFMILLNPGYITPLVTHPIGRLMLGCGIISQITGAFFINQILKIDG